MDHNEPQPKSWWAKQVTDDLYTAGRLTKRMIKGAAEDGFKSIVSLNQYDSDSSYYGEFLPESRKADILVTQKCGLEYAKIATEEEQEPSCKENLDSFLEVYQKLPKPMLFYCKSGFYSTFIAMYSLLKINQMKKEDDEADFTIKDFFQKASALGFDYTKNSKLMDLLKDLEGEIHCPEKLDIDPYPDWFQKCWMLKPVYKNWFISGQIQPNHVEAIKDAGFKTLINSRQGLKDPLTGKPSQEEVTLLNIDDNLKTYEGEGRQSEAELKQHLLDEEKPNDYIDIKSEKNFESINPNEFGDEVGYNEEIQASAVKDAGIQYIHQILPMPGSETDYSLDLCAAYEDGWKKANSSGPVLAQSKTGHRSVMIALLAVGLQHNLSSDWAIDKANQMGYHFNATHYPEEVKLLQAALSEKKDKCCIL